MYDLVFWNTDDRLTDPPERWSDTGLRNVLEWGEMDQWWEVIVRLTDIELFARVDRLRVGCEFDGIGEYWRLRCDAVRELHDPTALQRLSDLRNARLHSYAQS